MTVACPNLQAVKYMAPVVSNYDNYILCIDIRRYMLNIKKVRIRVNSQKFLTLYKFVC